MLGLLLLEDLVRVNLLVNHLFVRGLRHVLQRGAQAASGQRRIQIESSLIRTRIGGVSRATCRKEVR